MSLTIAPNDLKFVIFASGHDYTLADSGDGDVQVFSHPFVPLNSVMYAGQWYFLVPDENGEPMDAVKDDIAHCTFTPALGDAFSTEGEVTVECHYHREYVYPEDTLVVDKTVSQKITVVNHGTVQESNTYCDLYSDGYGFYRPSSVNTVNNNMWLIGTGSPSKLSSIPWRTQKLGNGIYGFCSATNLTDISELQYADTSRVIEMSRLLTNAQHLTSQKVKEAIGGWNVESLQVLTYCFNYSGLTDLSFMEKWNTPNLVSIDFEEMTNLVSAHGVEHLNTSKVTSLRHLFFTCVKLADISALADWDTSKVQTLEGAFNRNEVLSDISALSNWNVSALKNIAGVFERCLSLASLEPLGNWSPAITSMNYAFKECTSLRNLKGLENLDVSGVTSMYQVFWGDVSVRSLTGVEGWNVGNVTTFEAMFVDLHFLTDILPLKDWDMHSALNIDSMFQSNGFLANVDGVIWNMPNLVSNGGAFTGHKLWYSSVIDKTVFETFWYYYDIDGNAYMGTNIYDVDHPLVQVWKDASEAENWTVGGTNLGTFNNVEWNNLPSWN